MKSIPSDAQITAEIAYDALNESHQPTPLSLIAELHRLADHIEQMDSGSGEVELLRAAVSRIECLQNLPSTLEVTIIKQRYPLYDERQIYDACRLFVEIRNSTRLDGVLPHGERRKFAGESR